MTMHSDHACETSAATASTTQILIKISVDINSGDYAFTAVIIIK